MMTAEPAAAISVDGPHGPIRLKWHKLRMRYDEAPFKPANLALGWRLGASLEIDILATADERFVVAHDPTLGPSTTGRGRVADMPLASMAGVLHRDRQGAGDPEAPLLSLGDLIAPLRTVGRGSGAGLQLDLVLPGGRSPSQPAIDAAAAAVAGLEDAVIVGSYHLREARRLVAAIPAARLGYDPTRAASRNSVLGRDPERLFRHLERRRDCLALAYLRFDIVVAAEVQHFPLVARLLDVGIETDAWTINPGRDASDAILRALVESKVRQITTDAPTEIAHRIAGLY
jgi:glycerophosphoryl diester phosphodiesterase